MRYFLSFVATLLFGMTAFAADTTSLAGTSWGLVSFNESYATGTISFTQDTVSTHFCNNISQKYIYDGSTLVATDVGISTMMYCEEELLRTLDTAFKIDTAANVLLGTDTMTMILDDVTLGTDTMTITTAAKDIFVFKKVIPVTQIDQLSRNCIDALDECKNVCHRGDNEAWACTKMSCEIKVAPECTKKKMRDMIYCTQDYVPVCGVDGNTYSNVCSAGDVVIAHTGECASIVGSDSDEHGCKASAGYTWDAIYGQCIRPWEKEQVLNFAVSNKITSATTLEQFRPADTITRQEAAAVFVRTAERLFNKRYASFPDNCNILYKDDTIISKDFKEIVYSACAFDLMVGNQGHFSPQ